MSQRRADLSTEQTETFESSTVKAPAVKFMNSSMFYPNLGKNSHIGRSQMKRPRKQDPLVFEPFFSELQQRNRLNQFGSQLNRQKDIVKRKPFLNRPENSASSLLNIVNDVRRGSDIPNVIRQPERDITRIGQVPTNRPFLEPAQVLPLRNSNVIRNSNNPMGIDGTLKVPNIIANLFNRQFGTIPRISHAISSAGPIELPSQLRKHGNLAKYLGQVPATTTTTLSPLAELLQSANLRRKTTTTTPTPATTTPTPSRRTSPTPTSDESTAEQLEQLRRQNQMLLNMLRKALGESRTPSRRRWPSFLEDQMETSESNREDTVLKRPLNSQIRFRSPPKVQPLSAINQHQFTILQPQSIPLPKLYKGAS